MCMTALAFASARRSLPAQRPAWRHMLQQTQAAQLGILMPQPVTAPPRRTRSHMFAAVASLGACSRSQATSAGLSVAAPRAARPAGAPGPSARPAPVRADRYEGLTDGHEGREPALAQLLLERGRRRHHLATVHGQREQVPRALRVGEQRAHEVDDARVKRVRQPLAGRVGPVAPAAGRHPQQLAALRAARREQGAPTWPWVGRSRDRGPQTTSDGAPGRGSA